ncbi:MAG: pilus assembly protein PilM [bacterium]
MGFLGLGGGGEYLSVDFGASALKIVKATFPAPQTAKISLADSEPVRDVPPDEFIEECSQTLKTLIERNNISSSLNVVIALPSNSVIVRRMELPAMPEDRMAQVIRYEAESHIPFPLDQVVIDYHVIERTEEGTELILSAVKKDKLNEFLEVIYGAGLNPAIIDIAAFSLFNLYQYLGDDSRPQDSADTEEDGGEAEDNRPPARAIVDIGHGNTDIIVARGDMLYFARSASVAGESITAEIAKRMEVDLEEAEKLKIEHGHIPLDGMEEQEDTGMDALAELAAQRKAREEAEAETESAPEASEPAAPPPPAEEEPEEEKGAGGLTLGAPRKPEEKAESKPPAPPTGKQDEDEGLTLGTPASPEQKKGDVPPAPPKSKKPSEEEPAEVETESKISQEPGSVPPTPPPSPAKQDDEPEKGDEGLTLGPPRKPVRKSEGEAPVLPRSGDEEDGGLTLGSARPPEKEKESKPPAPPAGGEEKEEDDSVSPGAPGKPEKETAGEVEGSAPQKPASPGSPDNKVASEEPVEEPEKKDENEGLTLGTPRPPEKKKTGVSEDESSGAKKQGDSGSTLTGGGMLKGATKKTDKEDKAEKPSLLGSSEKSSGKKLLGSAGEGEGGKLLGSSSGDKKKDKDENSDKSLGAAANNSDASPAVDEEMVAAVGAAVKPQVDRLIGELRHTFDYFQSQLDGGEISEVVLSGGSSKLKNLPTFISNQLGYPVRRFNPVKKIKGCENNIIQEMLVAIGLQLRVVPERAILNVNLVPPDIIQKKRAQTKKQKITVLSVLAGILLVLLTVSAGMLYMKRAAEIQQSETEIETLKPIVEQVDKLEETQNVVAERLDTIEELERNKAKILALLYEINRLPDDLRERTFFKDINLSRGQGEGDATLNITGVTGDFDDASQIFRWLENRPYIIKHESEDVSRSTYSINEREVNMTDFTAQYSVSFSEE